MEYVLLAENPLCFLYIFHEFRWSIGVFRGCRRALRCFLIVWEWTISCIDKGLGGLHSTSRFVMNGQIANYLVGSNSLKKNNCTIPSRDTERSDGRPDDRLVLYVYSFSQIRESRRDKVYWMEYVTWPDTRFLALSWGTRPSSRIIISYWDGTIQPSIALVKVDFMRNVDNSGPTQILLRNMQALSDSL